MSPQYSILSSGSASPHSLITAMLFSSKSIVFALVALVVAVGAVPTSLNERCHLTNRVCNPHTAETCPTCCFPEQCIGKPCEVDCDVFG
ncbi:hypothetical protein B0J17DRAFT_636433 [Rhizoctonia solani]|nr:hypothetical protein B0J17DRAFT_636433 [Rhizoctonia solani]